MTPIFCGTRRFTGLYPEPDQSNPYRPHPTRFNIILQPTSESSYLCENEIILSRVSVTKDRGSGLDERFYLLLVRTTTDYT
jgi:hypothetical protein